MWLLRWIQRQDTTTSTTNKTAIAQPTSSANTSSESSSPSTTFSVSPTLSSTSSIPQVSTSNTLSHSISYPSSTKSSFVTSSPSPTSTGPQLTPSPTPLKDNSNTGVASGAVAGIAIGTFIAGIVVALLAVCIIAMLKKKRRHRSHSSRHHDGDRGLPPDTPLKEMTSTTTAIANPSTPPPIQKLLLDPVPTPDIKSTFLSISTSIVQHVDNNYHLNPVSLAPAQSTQLLDTLARAKYDSFTGVSAEQLLGLLVEPRTRKVALRHLVGWFVASRVALTGDAETSLLPAVIVNFLRRMPTVERTAGSREAFNLALTQWRLLSSYLLQSTRSHRSPLHPSDPPDAGTLSAQTTNLNFLRTLLAPFLLPGAERRQVDNLHGLTAEVAKLGLWLFGQPETWVVDWDVGAAAAGGGAATGVEADNARKRGQGQGRGGVLLVLFPGLIRTADVEGRRYVQAKTVVVPEVLQL